MRNRWAIEDMQRLAASRGGVCLSQQYERTGAHLEWQCSEGHRWRAVAYSVLQGNWCPTCARSRRRLRDSIETMQAIAASKGGRCLSEQYVGCFTALEWECGQGHRWKAAPSSVKHRTWCAECARLARAHTIEEMRAVARERGGQCLSKVYVNNVTPLQWCCARGHRWKGLPNGVLQGRWCRQCYYDSMRGTLASMQELAESRGGRCLSERYIDAKTHLVWECARGHTWRAVPHSVADGTWCRQCAVLDRCLHDDKRRKYVAVNHRV